MRLSPCCSSQQLHQIPDPWLHLKYCTSEIVALVLNNYYTVAIITKVSCLPAVENLLATRIEIKKVRSVQLR